MKYSNNCHCGPRAAIQKKVDSVANWIAGRARNDRAKFAVILFLIVLYLILVSRDSFNDFRELKEKVVESRQAITGGREINFTWNKAEARLEPVAEVKSGGASTDETAEETAGDLDDDGKNEKYVLSDGFLEIKQGDKLIWRSPEEWWIDGYVLADANDDGKKEINLSVWKAGDFGLSKPFWIKKNDLSIKNHFFVMSLIGDAVKPLWQSSNLEKPNCEFLFGDIDGDGKQELIVLEGEYDDEYVCQGKYLALWRWNGWGFTNEWRSRPARYEALRLSPDGRSLSALAE